MDNLVRNKKDMVAGVHYTTNHQGKMKGVVGISTSVTVNPICQQRVKDGESICSHCFSQRMWNPENGTYRHVRQCYEDNFRILNERLLSPEELPYFDPKYTLLRVESFGDVWEPVQAMNYINMVKANPHMKAAAWTKNPGIWAKALEKLGKPENLQMVLSSRKLNEIDDASKWGFFDKVFTVFDKKHATEVEINCGARSCLTCQRCYNPNPSGMELMVVNEKLKP